MRFEDSVNEFSERDNAMALSLCEQTDNAMALSLSEQTDDPDGVMAFSPKWWAMVAMQVALDPNVSDEAFRVYAVIAAYNTSLREATSSASGKGSSHADCGNRSRTFQSTSRNSWKLAGLGFSRSPMESAPFTCCFLKPTARARQRLMALQSRPHRAFVAHGAIRTRRRFRPAVSAGNASGRWTKSGCFGWRARSWGPRPRWNSWRCTAIFNASRLASERSCGELRGQRDWRFGRLWRGGSAGWPSGSPWAWTAQRGALGRYDWPTVAQKQQGPPPVLPVAGLEGKEALDATG